MSFVFIYVLNINRVQMNLTSNKFSDLNEANQILLNESFGCDPFDLLIFTHTETHEYKRV